jgi:hypothetical protein
VLNGDGGSHISVYERRGPSDHVDPRSRVGRIRLRCDALDLREEEIVLETDRYRIAGKLTLPREGYRSRLSDYVNQRDREFFALSDVTISELDGATEPQARPFLMVARAHVRLIGIAGES